MSTFEKGNQKKIFFVSTFLDWYKINLIIIEAFHSPKIESEKCFLLDQDLCIIEL